MVVKPGKNHRKNKNRCRDLCWMIHHYLQSFGFILHTMHELRDQNVAIGGFLGQ